jgi:hypothetical protein
MHEIFHHGMPESTGKGKNNLFDIAAGLEASQGLLNALVYGYFTGDVSRHWHLPLQALPCCLPCAHSLEQNMPGKASLGVKGKGAHTAFVEHVDVCHFHEFDDDYSNSTLSSARPVDQDESGIGSVAHTQSPLKSPLTETPGTDDRIESMIPIALCALLTMVTAVLVLVWVIHK